MAKQKEDAQGRITVKRAEKFRKKIEAGRETVREP